MQAYSNPKRESDPHSLPDIEVFEMTAVEVAETMEDEIYEALKVFPQATMNSKEREKAFDWIIEKYDVTGGFFWWACFPGCLPDGEKNGPFATRKEALEDAQSNNDFENDMEDGE